MTPTLAPTLTWQEAETLDRTWTDAFAARHGWTEHDLQDPARDLDMLFHYLPGPRVLDVGCGWGRYVHRFLDEGLQYHGVDFSAEMLKVARQNYGNETFTEASFRKLPFADAKFDGAWCCCSLYGVPKADITAALQEIARVLVPDGIIYVVMQAPGYSDEEVHRDADGKPERLLVCYHLEEFLDYATKAGLTTVEANYRHGDGAFYAILEKKEYKERWRE